MTTPHNHAEAFALMQYACDCGHYERMWNSRDGVTPFGTNCPSCGGMGTLRHVYMRQDECAPDHKPHRGQRFWRDGTADEAVAIIDKRIASYPDIPADVADLMREEARTFTGSWNPGWPMLDVAL